MDVVLLHGFAERATVWDEFIKHLPESNTYLRLDYANLTFCQTIEEYADWVNSELEERNIEKIALIGHSMGGYISMAFAEKYPEKLVGLGLFHTTAYADSEEKKNARLKTVDFIEKFGTAVFVEDFLPNMYHRDYRKLHKDAILESLDDNRKIKKEALIVATLAMRNRIDRSLILEKLEIPIFCIIGKDDKFISYESSLELIKLIHNPDVLILNKVAHAGFAEATLVCSVFITNFLNDLN
jgi:pimeloyl-ACP methyl ester carboxylesterase